VTGREDARAARALCAGERQGALATLAREPAGYPYGSLVLYALDHLGRPLLLISRLAEHTANLAHDPRASLLVVAPAGGEDPLARARVTLLGRVTPVPEPDLAAARTRYLTRLPAAELYLRLPDFAFFRLEVEGVRYVGGFGRMAWISGEDYAAGATDDHGRP
jgi:putative heme iron utilization protein